MHCLNSSSFALYFSKTKPPTTIPNLSTTYLSQIPLIDSHKNLTSVISHSEIPNPPFTSPSTHLSSLTTISTEIPDITPENLVNHALTMLSNPSHISLQSTKSPHFRTHLDPKAPGQASEDLRSDEQDEERFNLCNKIENKKIKKEMVRMSHEKKKKQGDEAEPEGEDEIEQNVAMKGRNRITMSQNYKSTLLRGFGRLLSKAGHEK